MCGEHCGVRAHRHGLVQLSDGRLQFWPKVTERVNQTIKAEDVVNKSPTTPPVRAPGTQAGGAAPAAARRQRQRRARAPRVSTSALAGRRAQQRAAQAPSARPRRCLEVELVELVERGTHSSLSLFCAIDILFANGCTARRVVLPQGSAYDTLSLRPSRQAT